MLTPLAIRWHTGNSPFPFSVKQSKTNIDRRGWIVRPCSPEQWFQLSSANTAQIIGDLFAQY